MTLLGWVGLLARTLAIVMIVVVMYWAVFLPNPGGLNRSEAVSRSFVRILAVIAMLVLGICLVLTRHL